MVYFFLKNGLKRDDEFASFFSPWGMACFLEIVEIFLEGGNVYYGMN